LIICPRVTGRAARSIPHPLGWGGRPQFDLGPTFYYAEYTLTDTKGKAKEKVIVDLPFSTVVDFNKSNVSVPEDKKDYYFNDTSLQQQREIRKQDANAKWKSIEERMTMETIPAGYTSTRSIGYIYDVPNYP
ncbi:hypothetical protein, partial [Methanosarcina mazei]